MTLTTLGLLSLLGTTQLDTHTPALASHAPTLDATAHWQLRSPLLERAERSAQQSTEAASAAPTASEAPASEAGDAPAAPEEEEPSIDLMRMRARSIRMHRPLG